ncbi:hypothetical protein LTS18_013231 [Coniosporium uncinatum]|uniref:Uncharacterized protein n=1 Tax=Coniosporium uncinatum TaxID=93489 RepID=A0ACC3DW28_9PEZI|nr:hypothetical protein LTS18_013231 [Coniosporium uncinatum]
MITLRDNEEAYNRYTLRPRILRNVSSFDFSTALFGIRTTQRIIERAESERMNHGSVQDVQLTFQSESGYKAVFVSVDLPVLGTRVNESCNNFSITRGRDVPGLGS